MSMIKTETDLGKFYKQHEMSDKIKSWLISSDIAIYEAVSHGYEIKLDEHEWIEKIQKYANEVETKTFDAAYNEGVKHGYKIGYDDRGVNRPANFDLYGSGLFPCPFCGDHGFDKSGLKYHLDRYCEHFKNTSY